MKPSEDEAHCNPSANDEFGAILEAALSRRSVLKGGLGLAAIGFLAGPRELMAQSALIGFGSVPLTGEDRVIVANGYRAEVLYAWGDPISNGPAWDPNVANSAEEQAVQAGMHHDGMHFFPLPLGSNSSSRGLLAINHEYTDEGLLHRTAQNPWTPDKVLKSQAAHGVSIIEAALDGDRWRVVRPSGLARRITAFTPIAISGPAAGDEAMRTNADPSGTRVLGTLNNCANGYTPWGTYLTCEENFNGYFVNRGTITPLQSRYGISATPAGYRWYEHDGRFDARVEPNEANRFGWVVEIDPYNPGSTPVKRTALGRLKHEGASVTLAADGRVVVYQGDDERFEYIYKFVSSGRFDSGNRGANFDLLDTGTLYAARFNADGTGNWLELAFGENGLDEAAGFSSQADVLINARGAADKAGATKMDRPEWIAVNPLNRDVFVTLTNNTQRGDTGRAQPDAANPRKTNAYGHIVRWREDGSDPAALSFRWSIFALAGDPRQSDTTKRGNVKGDTYGSPDGLWVDGRGVLWIQTDISSGSLGTGDYVNIPTNMMLAADPASGQTRRFLTGPRGAEITGITAPPDLRTLFINVQHPGEGSAEFSNPNNPAAVSTWPDGPGINRPRSATVVIRKQDGGIIGT